MKTYKSDPFRKLLATLACLAAISSPAAIRTVTNFDDGGPGTLRDTIAASASGDIIKFLPGLGVVTISLTSQIIIDKDLTIVGNGVNNLVIEGGGSTRLFLVTNATVSISALTLANGTVVGNWGGAILNYGNLTISNCSLTNCTALFGGGIANGAVLIVDDSSFSYNRSSEKGGGIFGFAAQATIRGCTFWGNRAAKGGGIFAIGAALTNCTFYLNGASEGGAIYAEARLSVNHCTIVGNHAGNGGGIFNPYDGPGFLSELSVVNTVIAENDVAVDGPDVTGSFNSKGYNLIGKTNTSLGWLPVDQVGSQGAPLFVGLGPLQDNGGPTRTIMPSRFEDQLLDRGTSGGGATDQRGKPRTYDSYLYFNAVGGDGSDIGAVEVNPPTISVQPQPANTCVLAGDNITYTVTASGEMPLKYRWIKQFSGQIPGATNASYTVTNVHGTNAGVYWVVVEDNYQFSLESSNVSLILGFTLGKGVSGGGTVLATPDQPVYCPNSSVTLTATPSNASQPTNGWVFDHWSGNASGTNNPLNVVLTTNKVVTANFAKTFKLTLGTTSGGGGVAVSSSELTYPTYRSNTLVILTAQPNPGWTFVGWSGNASGTSDPINVSMTTNLSITANFIAPPLINIQPQSQTNRLGGSATFTVTAGGSSPLQYQWRSNGTNISGAAGSVYTRANIQAGDLGAYSVVITNSYGAVTSSTAILSLPVLPPGVIAQWDFNSFPPDDNWHTGTTFPEYGIGTATTVGGVSANFDTGAGSADPADPPNNSSWNTHNYPSTMSANKTAGVQFNANTAGWKNIRVSWQQTISDSSSRYGRLQYSSNGIDFIDFPTATSNNVADTFLSHSNNLSFASTLNNQPAFAIRIVTEFQNTATGNGQARYVTTTGGGYSSGGDIVFHLLTVWGDSTNPVATLSAPIFTNNQFQFNLTGQAGSSYVIQATTNLSSPSWLALRTNTSPFTFVETNTLLFPQRFYRAMFQP